MHMRRSLAFLAVVVLAIGPACGGDDETAGWDPTEVVDQGADVAPDEGGEVDMGQDLNLPDIPLPRIATGIETTVQSQTVTAGELVVVTCQILDQDGLPFSPEGLDTRVAIGPQGAVIDDAGTLLAVRAGVATAQCSLAELGLIDDTPAEFTILAGPVDEVTTTLDLVQMTAGESLSASCAAFDAYGNPVDDAEFELVVAPGDTGVSVVDLTATITTAGIFEVSCSVLGASYEESELVEVVPGLPAALTVSLVPNQNVYALDEVVSLTWVVTDEYGNVIPNARVDVTSVGGQSFGTGRFRYNVEGTYTIRAEVTGPTLAGPLAQDVTITINSEGPAINCDSPYNGQMLNKVPGTILQFTGSVGDANGVSSVLVNGMGVTVAADGAFSHAITLDWGINFVDIVAQDAFGEENSRTCAFLIADNWASRFGFLDDSVVLKLTPPAIDDQSTSDLDSLNDILYQVLNSAGLVSQLDASLTAANPLKDSCDQQICVFGCVCVHRSKLTYKDMNIAGPQSSTLAMVSGGLRSTATARNINMKVDVESTLYDGTGWARLSYLKVDLTIDVKLVNGRPSASVRQVNSVNVGAVDLDFPGFGGVIIDILQTVFQGMIRNLLRDAMRDFIKTSFNDVLDGVFSSLDVSTLGTTLAVPRLDSGTVNINFGLNFSSILMRSNYANFGIGTRFRAARTQVSLPTLGAALPPGPTSINPPVGAPANVGVYVGMLNQVLHALWRGGYFRATIDGSTLGGSFPAGTRAVINTALPPVVELLSNGRARVMIGAMDLDLFYPGLFDSGLSMQIGALGTTSVQLSGNDLVFGGLVLDQLYFSTDSVSLDATTRAVIQTFLQDLLQSILNSSLNNALPALPIPSFTLPAALSQYGLPAGREMGIVNPVFSQTLRQFLLRGSFGLR